MTEFLMPSLGADMEGATVVEWNVQAGQPFKKGDIIATVETDKGIIDIEIFDQGVIDTIIVQTGQKVAVNTVLATYLSDDETSTTSIRQKISPAARRRAAQLQLPLQTLHGSGPQQSITLEDVEKAAALSETTALSQETALSTKKALSETLKKKQPLTTSTQSNTAKQNMRQAIAKTMLRSKQEIPHYYLAHSIDCHQALQWMTAENANRSISQRLVFSVLLLKAVANALPAHPDFNGVMKGEQFHHSDAIHIAIAVSLRQGGLIAPTIHDTNKKDLTELMTDYRKLINRARHARLTNSEVTDATITLSSLGEQGVDAVYPIIYPPQVAIIGFGSVAERAWSVDGKIVSRRIIQVTLAADHRVSDGHRGASLLRAIDTQLQQPEALMS